MNESYPEGFIEACRKAYQRIGPLSYAEEILGCWIFATPEVLYTSGPYGVKISTKEVIHIHIPALITDESYAQHLSELLGEPIPAIKKAFLADEGSYPKLPIPDRFKQPPASWSE